MSTGSTHEFHQRLVGDAATAVRALTVAVGERLGLYEALADGQFVTAAELAERAGIQEMYAREWLHAQASGGYVETDPEGVRFALSPHAVPVLADAASDVYLAPFFSALKALFTTEDGLVRAFRDGGGVGWDEHDGALDDALARFFLPGYRANLVPRWIPALTEVSAKLEAGARVADVGCGVGYATLLMAEAYPHSSFHGFDYSAEAIAQARQQAAALALPAEQEVAFTATAGDVFTGGPFDLITSFNCVHDIGDPVGVAKHIRSQLDDDGTWMIVEPNADPNVNSNSHPAGQLFMALSPVMCLPAAAAQKGPHALGNHSGEEALRKIAQEAGFSRWRLADTTPVSAVWEARP